jgi:hypothetical protein
LPPDLIPEVIGLLFRNDLSGSYDYHRSLFPLPGELHSPMILQRGIAAGYSQPSIIDFKLGDRSWIIVSPASTAARRSAKVAEGVCPHLYFRVRVALWRGTDEKFEKVPAHPSLLSDERSEMGFRLSSSRHC